MASRNMNTHTFVLFCFVDHDQVNGDIARLTFTNFLFISTCCYLQNDKTLVNANLKASKIIS